MDITREHIMITASELEQAWGTDSWEWGLRGPTRIDPTEDMRFEPVEGSPEWTWSRHEDDIWHPVETIPARDILALCATIDELAQLAGVWGALDTFDLADLPTYGGHEPDETLGVYSWDATRVLTIEGDEIALMPRVEWEEPSSRDMDDATRVGLVRSLRAMRRDVVALQVAEMIESVELRAIMMEAQS